MSHESLIEELMRKNPPSYPIVVSDEDFHDIHERLLRGEGVEEIVRKRKLQEYLSRVDGPGN